MCDCAPDISKGKARTVLWSSSLSSLLVLWLAERPWMSAEEHWNLSFPINEKVVKGTLWTLIVSVVRWKQIFLQTQFPQYKEYKN